MEKTDKRTDILEAAEELFSTLGFDGTSTRQIAKASGANMAMINYYFGGKEGVFLEIMENRIAAFRPQLESINREDISFEEKLIKVMDQYAIRIFKNINLHKMMHRELSLSQRPEVFHKVKAVMAGNRRVIEHIVEQGIEQGAFRLVDVRMTIVSIMGTIHLIATSPEKVIDIPDFDMSNVDHQEILRKRVIDYLQDLLITHLTIRK